MKKTTMIVAAFLLSLAGLRAQSLKDGIADLDADRFKGAIAVFEKLLAANPNNVEATYWLGQTYLDEDRNDLARDLYAKALVSSNNAPLILVGAGHVDLLDKKTAEARQKFETAITATTTKKGGDPDILNAVGRANVDAKAGDMNYAVSVLEQASQRDSKNPNIWLNLGNAYRKQSPGEGGGRAIQAYQHALDVDAHYAIAYLRISKLFESQKNWDPMLENLNKAIQADPNFSPAYYELFYYYFFRNKFDDADAYLQKYIDSRKPETYIADQYLYAQLCWARKDFDCAITKAQSVLNAEQNFTKPKVYKLLADAYLQKNDVQNARKYLDQYLQREKEPIAFDMQLKADIYSKIPGMEDTVFNAYLSVANLDTVVDNKIEVLKKGAQFFKDAKQRDKEAQLLTKMIELKPKPIINDYFDVMIADYYSQQYAKSRDWALTMIDKYPNEIYGYDWAFNNAKVIDTVRKDSIAVPDAMKLINFASTDTVKFKRQIISSASFLGIYYANDKGVMDSAIMYLRKWQAVDSANADKIEANIQILQKAQARQQTGTPPKGNALPKAPKREPAEKPRTAATTDLKKD